MDTVVINIKTKREVKAKAQKVASDLGFSLSSLINGYLNQLVKTKTIHFSLVEEEPNEYMIQALKESEKDRRKGKYVSFKDTDETIRWLNSSKRKLFDGN